MLGRGNDGGMQLVPDGRADDDDRTGNRDTAAVALIAVAPPSAPWSQPPPGANPRAPSRRRHGESSCLAASSRARWASRSAAIWSKLGAVPVTEHEGAVAGQLVGAELQARAAELVGGAQQPVELVVRHPAVGGLLPGTVERRPDRPLREAARAETRVAVREDPSGLTLVQTLDCGAVADHALAQAQPPSAGPMIARYLQER